MSTRIESPEANSTPGDSSDRRAPLPERLRRVAVVGARVTVSTFREAQDALAALVDHGRGAYVSSGNAYSLTMALADTDYQAAVNGSSYVTADGVPVVWALRCLGHRAERVHTDDLFLSCCERFPAWKHFLVGGRRDQPEAVAAQMSRRFPGIEIVGTHATPARPLPPDETAEVLERIRAAGTDIVWVGMGTPAQDHWMSENAERAGVPMVGVGSGFDLLAGRTRVTPDWMKRNGLQWLFRLWQEPRRLAFRYGYHNLWFIIAFARQLASQALSRT